MQRWLAGILAVFNVVNGLVMLFAGSIWWAHVPGARETGPFNPHFVQDVGAAFAVSGLALGVRAWRPRYWPAAVAGAGFLAAHALIHVAMIARGHDQHTVEDLLAVIVPAALAFYSAFPNPRERNQENENQENKPRENNKQENDNMRSFIARRVLRAVSKRYGYDTSYLEYMLKESPAAFFKFAPLMKASAYREVVPPDASFAARITGAMAEDCGPCVQLVVDMALEAGMAKDQIEAVVRRDTGAMNAAAALGFGFADAVLSRAAHVEQHRQAVRARWGEKGVIDLAMALQMSRVFPMMKAALGYARECRRVTVDGQHVDVIKQAA
jgi:hypothetical protein